jgi:hypothetical protein
LFETAAVPVADEPPAVVRADDVLPTAPDVLDWAPLEDPVVEPLVVTAVPAVVTEFVCVPVVVGKLTAP